MRARVVAKSVCVRSAVITALTALRTAFRSRRDESRKTAVGDDKHDEGAEYHGVIIGANTANLLISNVTVIIVLVPYVPLSMMAF